MEEDERVKIYMENVPTKVKHVNDEHLDSLCGPGAPIFTDYGEDTIQDTDPFSELDDPEDLAATDEGKVEGNADLRDKEEDEGENVEDEGEKVEDEGEKVEDEALKPKSKKRKLNNRKVVMDIKPESRRSKRRT